MMVKGKGSSEPYLNTNGTNFFRLTLCVRTENAKTLSALIWPQWGIIFGLSQCLRGHPKSLVVGV